ncbi:MAG TPA: PAS domain S-box protein, partial [Terriglobales bacterium]|nr:PAS domain S-box protein [Terriglobales bacterium]
MLFSVIIRAYQQKREFFRWWIQAWCAFAIFLGANALAFQLPESSSWNLVLTTIATVAGFLELVYLTYGARSFANPEDQRGSFLATVLAMAGALAVCAIPFFEPSPLFSISIRAIPRQVLLCLAFWYCAVIFWSRREREGSGAKVLSASCLLWGGNVLVLAGCTLRALLRQDSSLPAMFLGSDLPFEGSWFFLNLFAEFGMALGTIMLLAKQQKQSQLQIHESEAEIRLLVEQQPAVLWVVDRDLRFVSTQGSGLAAVGLMPGEGVGSTLFEYLHTDDPNYLPIACTLRALKGDESSFEMPWRRRLFETHVRPLRDGEGKITGAFGISTDITERKQAERAIRASEANYRMLMEQASDAILIIDHSGKFLEVNSQFCKMLGYTRQELSQAHSKDFLLAEDYESFLKQIPGMKPGSSLRVERRLRHKNGSTVHVEASVKALADGRILSISRDVTSRKQAEESLSISEERYRSLVQQSSEGIFVVDPSNMRIQEANAAMLAMLGYRPDEIKKLKLYDIVVDTPDSVDENVRRTLRERRIQIANRRYRRKDGSLIDVEIRGSVVQYGQSELVLANVIDLTERKSTEFELQMITEQLRTVSSAMTEFLETGNWNTASQILLHGALIQTQSEYGFVGVVVESELRVLAHDGIVWDEQTNREFYDKVMESYKKLGYLSFPNLDNLFGRVVTSGKPITANNPASDPQSAGSLPAGHPALKNFLGVPILKETVVVGMIAVANRSGGYSIVEQQKIEALVNAAGVLYDSYRRSLQEESLLKQKRKAQEEQAELHLAVQNAANEWRLTFDAIQFPIFMTDQQGIVVRLNRAARDLTGMNFSDLLGKPLQSFGEHQPWTAAAEIVHGTVEDREHPKTVQVYDEFSGKTWDLLGYVVSTGESDSNLDRFIVALRDITPMVELQESLRRSETMSTMGALVAGVAHEVRNPLFCISATLDALEAKFDKMEGQEQYLNVLKREIKRLNDLMSELLEYGKPARLELIDESLQAVMDRAIQNCSMLAEQSKVQVVNTADLRSVILHMDQMRMTEVFQNIIDNAIRHSPPGATVQIRAQEWQTDGQSWISCFVEDNGPGIRNADLPKIFQPFFTKRRGGTGLGLPIVQRIVEAHGGKVVAFNHPKGGAVLRVSLPYS